MASRDMDLEKAYEMLKQNGYTMRPEPKKRRVQLVMTKSLYLTARKWIEDMVDPTTGKPLSFNQYISDLVRADLEAAMGKQRLQKQMKRWKEF